MKWLSEFSWAILCESSSSTEVLLCAFRCDVFGSNSRNELTKSNNFGRSHGRKSNYSNAFLADAAAKIEISTDTSVHVGRRLLTTYLRLLTLSMRARYTATCTDALNIWILSLGMSYPSGRLEILVTYRNEMLVSWSNISSTCNPAIFVMASARPRFHQFHANTFQHDKTQKYHSIW